MPDSDFRNLFLEAESHLVGIWKYREKGEPVKWYATIIINGEYFDIEGFTEVYRTLEKVLEVVNQNGH